MCVKVSTCKRLYKTVRQGIKGRRIVGNCWLIECRTKNQNDFKGILARCDSGPELNNGTKKPFPIMGRALIEGVDHLPLLHSQRNRARGNKPKKRAISAIMLLHRLQ